ncbi:DUF456 domain-containing protein [Paenibacillus sp. MBLB4367]|uniref:DUF456 domain-containing protein n=1 Tax=Paenibacillus sp. MBLB4367 TaxID=3384767 RepID=UPI003907F534
MAIIGWLITIALFAVGMAGAIVPVLPGAVAILLGFVAYGLFLGFAPFGFWFWFIQITIVVVITIADYAVGAWGVKKYGGSRASVIGSTIGIIAGPFVIPVAGLLLGPFLGAFLGELVAGSNAEKSLKVGFGAVVGLFSSTVVKLVLQLIMIVLFLVWVL